MRLLLLALLLLAPLLPLAASAYDKIVVLTAGITTYDHGDPRPACAQKKTLCHLPNAGRDAADFADLMSAGPWLGPVEVRRLPEAEATKAGILRALRAAGRSAGSGKTLVLFYFTGHGLTYGDVGFIVPRDGRQDDPDSWISVTTLRDLLRQPELGEVRHVLFILASCFSGTLLKGDVIPADAELQVATPADQRYIERELGRRARVGITAGLDGERIPDGRRGEGSDFGRALVQALTPAHGLPSMPADQNGDGCVTHLELASYVHNKGRSDHNTPALGTPRSRRSGDGAALPGEAVGRATPARAAHREPEGPQRAGSARRRSDIRAGMAETTTLRLALRLVPPGTFPWAARRRRRAATTTRRCAR
ncbi:MAG: caspase family protein [bacterium]